MSKNFKTHKLDFQEYNNERERWQWFYRSKSWRSLRLMILADQPLCVDCLKDGLVEPAGICDHIIPLQVAPHLALEASNIQTQCHRHHSIKTMTVDFQLKQAEKISKNMEELDDFGLVE